MELQVSYYESDDILLLQNGHLWTDGSNVAENVIAYADCERNIVAVEVSGAADKVRKAFLDGKSNTRKDRVKHALNRPDETELERAAITLSVFYDPVNDSLTLASGLPTPFEQTIADGLVALYDGEDEFGKFVNGIRLERASVVLNPYLSP